MRADRLQREQEIASHGRWSAAVLAAGAGAVLSHRDAGALYGLVARRGPIHVTVPRRGPHGRRGLVLHATLRLPPEQWLVRDEIPVTTIPRTLLDIAEEAPGILPRAWDAAERLQLLDVGAVQRVCEEAHGRRGLKHLVPLVEDRTRVVGDTRLELEARLFELCRRHGLPLPSCNVLVEGYLVDALWPERRLIVELDSWKFHSGRQAFEADRERDAALQAAGYRVVRITWRQLERNPERVAALIAKLLGP